MDRIDRIDHIDHRSDMYGMFVSVCYLLRQYRSIYCFSRFTSWLELYYETVLLLLLLLLDTSVMNLNGAKIVSKISVDR